MLTPFRKMHGAGNDFIVIDGRAAPVSLSPATIAALSDRHTGIGCDQFIILRAPTGAAAWVRMDIYNNDGSTAGACGNATRCVAMLMAGEGAPASFGIETVAGILGATITDIITIDMGPPRLAWQDIPLARDADTLTLPIEGSPAACNIGNPHATLFVPDVAASPITTLGPALEHHPIFPDRANIGVAQILSPGRIRLRVWERSAGLTRACGSGACAALVNAHRRGLAGRRAEMLLDGGVLVIEWRADNHVLMSGPACLAFQGEVDLSSYPP
jgi:diaminopimelate epimerase